MVGEQQPNKQVVRDWLASEVKAHRPPPEMEEIRRQLGWHLLDAERHPEKQADRD